MTVLIAICFHDIVASGQTGSLKFVDRMMGINVLGKKKPIEIMHII